MSLLVADGLQGRGGPLAAQTVAVVVEWLRNERKSGSGSKDFLLSLARKRREAVNAAGEKLGLDPRSTRVAPRVHHAGAANRVARLWRPHGRVRFRRAGYPREGGGPLRMERNTVPLS